MRNIAVLGSTGSIGTQTLDVIEAFPELYRASVLACAKSWQKLCNQARKFRPDAVVI
nr:1-deoxy-D-xylulose-5-phosphate reductoisomerase [bacterium]